jgi:hypothetical protein
MIGGIGAMTEAPAVGLAAETEMYVVDIDIARGARMAET